MSNIQKYAGLQVSTVDDLARISKAMAASGMFNDIKDAAQAMVKIQAGAELGLLPFASMTGVHVISGKCVIGAGLMASMIDAHPDYDFEVMEHNNKICSIRFTKNGKQRGISTFTIQDAQNAGTKNLQKYPANMLYARAMSNGAKWYCPGVFAGPVYVPEEFEEETQDVQHQVVQPEPKAKAPKKENPVPVPPAVIERAEQHAAEPEPDFIHKNYDEAEVMEDEPAENLEAWTVKRPDPSPAPQPPATPELPLGYKKPNPSQAEKVQRAIMEKMCKEARANNLLTDAEVDKLLASYDEQPTTDLKFEKISKTKAAIALRKEKKQATETQPA